MLLYYNGKKIFGKRLELLKSNVRRDYVGFMHYDYYLWMATSRGLNRLDMSTHSIDRLGIEKYFSNTQVYAIEKIENDIWIGSKAGLFIYSNDNPRLINAKDLQKKEKVLDNFYNFTVIKKIII